LIRTINSKWKYIKGCKWLDPKIYEYIEKFEEYAIDILIIVTKWSDVNRDIVLLK
jgi:hypothetical protein